MIYFPYMCTEWNFFLLNKYINEFILRTELQNRISKRNAMYLGDLELHVCLCKDKNRNILS